MRSLSLLKCTERTKRGNHRGNINIQRLLFKKLLKFRSTTIFKRGLKNYTTSSVYIKQQLIFNWKEKQILRETAQILQRAKTLIKILVISEQNCLSPQTTCLLYPNLSWRMPGQLQKLEAEQEARISVFNAECTRTMGYSVSSCRLSQ